MKQKKIDEKVNKVTEIKWSDLNDRQKAQVLLNSQRIPDAETLLNEFESLEEPQLVFPKPISHHPRDEIVNSHFPSLTNSRHLKIGVLLREKYIL